MTGKDDDGFGTTVIEDADGEHGTSFPSDEPGRTSKGISTTTAGSGERTGRSRGELALVFGFAIGFLVGVAL